MVLPMRVLTTLLLLTIFSGSHLALAQAYPDPTAAPRERVRPLPDLGRPRLPASGSYNGIQIDATPLLMDPPPPGPAEREPRPTQRPMFSDGWTRDGFGGRPSGWR
jgi:hypothetical protein